MPVCIPNFMGRLRYDWGLRLESKRFRANQQRHRREHFSFTTSPPVTNRPSLRSHFRSLRQQLDSEVRAEKIRCLNERLSELNVLRQARNIAAYLASPEEASVTPFVEIAWQRAQAVFLPWIDAQPRKMVLRRYQPSDVLVKNRFGLFEPDRQNDATSANQLDCVLVPLVAFDDQGTRLGMGGGYYDSFFTEAKGRPLLIGAAFSEQYAAAPLPQAAWDVPLDFVVTDAGVSQFRKPGATWD